MCDPAVFLETAGLFALPTPMGLFLPSQQPLRESPKLPALRAEVDVLAQKSARLFSCLSAAASKIARFCLFGHLACACRKAAFLSAVRSALGAFRNAPARRRNIRYLGFRWARARLCSENRTQPRHAVHAGGRAVSCCASWSASNRFRMRSCSHSASSFASFCS